MLPDSFPQAAARHLYDAKILLDQQRWDNAVYLAGYVVECSFKVLVEVYIPEGKTAVKKYGHDLTELQGKAIDRLRLMYPVLMQLPTSQTQGTKLAENHPGRRYYKSGIWNQTEAEEAVNRAEEIYQEVITKLVLDGIISSNEF
ncbi:HEPN domain-containing protein [Anabaena sp. FACHB-1237]|nr:HEPN domain-containing protein [Anabaena sp. FACHB-1237]